jgi:hypothetical protein
MHEMGFGGHLFVSAALPGVNMSGYSLDGQAGIEAKDVCAPTGNVFPAATLLSQLSLSYKTRATPSLQHCYCASSRGGNAAYRVTWTADGRP